MGTFLFRWPYPADHVYVTGTFDDWGKTEKLDKVGDVFEKVVTLPSATDKVMYKFVVDDRWIVDDAAPKEDDGHYNVNNVLLPHEIAPLSSSPSSAGPGAVATANRITSGHRVVSTSDDPPQSSAPTTALSSTAPASTSEGDRISTGHRVIATNDETPYTTVSTAASEQQDTSSSAAPSQAVDTQTTSSSSSRGVIAGGIAAGTAVVGATAAAASAALFGHKKDSASTAPQSSTNEGTMAGLKAAGDVQNTAGSASSTAPQSASVQEIPPMHTHRVISTSDSPPASSTLAAAGTTAAVAGAGAAVAADRVTSGHKVVSTSDLPPGASDVNTTEGSTTAQAVTSSAGATTAEAPTVSAGGVGAPLITKEQSQANLERTIPHVTPDPSRPVTRAISQVDGASASKPAETAAVVGTAVAAGVVAAGATAVAAGKAVVDDKKATQTRTADDANDMPGGFPMTPGVEQENDNFRVNPLPATGHTENMESSATTSKEDYDRAGGVGTSADTALPAGILPVNDAGNITTSKDATIDPQVAVSPLPATGHDNLQSSVTTSKEDYDNAGGFGTATSTANTAAPSVNDVKEDTKDKYKKVGVIGAAGAAVAGVGAMVGSAFSKPKDKENVIPESSLPMNADKLDTKDTGPFLQSSGPGTTTAALASQVPLEPKRDAKAMNEEPSAPSGVSPFIQSSGPGTSTSALAAQQPMVEAPNTSTFRRTEGTPLFDASGPGPTIGAAATSTHDGTATVHPETAAPAGPTSPLKRSTGEPLFPEATAPNTASAPDTASQVPHEQEQEAVTRGEDNTPPTSASQAGQTGRDHNVGRDAAIAAGVGAAGIGGAVAASHFQESRTARENITGETGSAAPQSSGFGLGNANSGVAPTQYEQSTALRDNIASEAASTSAKEAPIVSAGGSGAPLITKEQSQANLTREIPNVTPDPSRPVTRTVAALPTESTETAATNIPTTTPAPSTSTRGAVPEAAIAGIAAAGAAAVGVGGTAAALAASRHKDGTSAAAALNDETRREKSAVEKELLAKVPTSEALGLPASAAAAQSSYYGLATQVPHAVESSMQKAHAPPEAAAEASVVAEKSLVERELQSKVARVDSAGEPAPAISAATTATAPGTTSSAADALTDGKTANTAVPGRDTSTATSAPISGALAGGAIAGGVAGIGAAALASRHKDADVEPSRVADSTKPDVTSERSAVTPVTGTSGAATTMPGSAATKAAAIPGVSPNAAAQVADGASTDIGAAPKIIPPVETSDASATEYAPPRPVGVGPGVSPAAALALSDGTEDPTQLEGGKSQFASSALADEPAVRMMAANETADATAADVTHHDAVTSKASQSLVHDAVTTDDKPVTSATVGGPVDSDIMTAETAGMSGSGESTAGKGVGATPTALVGGAVAGAAVASVAAGGAALSGHRTTGADLATSTIAPAGVGALSAPLGEPSAISAPTASMLAASKATEGGFSSAIGGPTSATTPDSNDAPSTPKKGTAQQAADIASAGPSSAVSTPAKSTTTSTPGTPNTMERKKKRHRLSAMFKKIFD